MEFDRSPISKSLSRRSLLASAGGVALGLVAGADRASALGVAPGQFQSSGDVAAATSAAISYLRSRTSVTTSNAFTDVSKWVYPDSRRLIEFEQNRFNSLGALGNPSAWNGVIENISSNVTVLDCSATSGQVRLSIRDWTGVQWRPALVLMHRTSEQEALVQRFPEKYGLNIPDFQLTTSGFGTSQGWLVAKDGYQEPIVALGGPSPDYVETSIANLSQLMVEPPSGLLRAGTPQLSTENLLGRTFYYASAVDYAMTWGGSARNAFYSDFTPTDCANFVSQCFTAGGYPTDGTWSPYTYAWVNNIGLRNWLIASGRGYSSSEMGMGFADIINYDWTNDGIFDHIAIVTTPNPICITSHTKDALNVPYKSIAWSYSAYLYASTLVTY